MNCALDLYGVTKMTKTWKNDITLSTDIITFNDASQMMYRSLLIAKYAKTDIARNT